MSVAGRAMVPFEGSFEGLTASAAKAVENVSQKFKGILGPTAIVGASVAAVAGAVIDLGAKYQKTTDAVAANARISIAAAQRIGTAFLATGGQTTFTAQTMLKAFAPVAGQLEFLNGKALSVGQSIAFTRAAMTLAEATGGDLTTTTANLAKVMQAFQILLTGASNATDILFNSSVALGVPIDSLTTALQRARTAAGAAAPSLQDLSAFVLDLAAHGESGRGAISLLGSALTGIEIPSAKVLKAQKDLGVAFLTTKGQLDPLGQIIAKVGPLIDGMGNAQATATLKSLGFGAASSKLVDLMQAGLPAFQKATDAVGKSGAAQAAADKNTSGLVATFDKLKSKVIDAATSFGVSMMPSLTRFGNWILTTGLPDLEKFGTWVDVNIIIPFVHVASVVIPILLGALSLVFKNLGFISAFAVPLAGVLAAIWAVDKIHAWSGAAYSAIQGVLARLGLLKVAGSAGGPGGVGVQAVYVTNWAQIAAGGGLYDPEFGAAKTAATGAGAAGLGATVGAAAFAGAVAVAAAVVIGMDWTLLTAKMGKGAAVIDTSNAARQRGPGAARFGALDAQANIDKATTTIATTLGLTVPQYKAFLASSKDIARTATDKGSKFGADFISLENHLQAMGYSFSVSASASSALQAYVTKYGSLSAVQIATFYQDLLHGQSSAFDIALSMQTINLKLAPAIDYAGRFAAALKAGLTPARAAVVAKYSRAGGGPITEDVIGVGQKTGAVWAIHDKEYVLTEEQMRGAASRPGALSSGARATGATITHNYVVNLYGTDEANTHRFLALIEQENAKEARAAELVMR